jgi:hypothetical protein
MIRAFAIAGSISRSHAPRLACAASVVLLASCQTPEPRTEVVAPAPVPIKAKITKPRPHHPPPERTGEAAPTPGVSAGPEEPEETPVNLVGLNPEQLETLLGSPGSTEQQGPDHRWVYRSGNCTLSVSLYANVDTREFHSLSYEVSGDDRTEQGIHHCLAQLAHHSDNAKSQ